MHADVRIGPRSGGGSRRSSVLPGPLGNEVGMSPAYADFEMPNTQMLADDFGFACELPNELERPPAITAADSALSRSTGHPVRRRFSAVRCEPCGTGAKLP